jgi:hypothetical protein
MTKEDTFKLSAKDTVCCTRIPPSSVLGVDFPTAAGATAAAAAAAAATATITTTTTTTTSDRRTISVFDRIGEWWMKQSKERKIMFYLLLFVFILVVGFLTLYVFLNYDKTYEDKIKLIPVLFNVSDVVNNTNRH